jgi:hypothetical protein
MDSQDGRLVSNADAEKFIRGRSREEDGREVLPRRKASTESAEKVRRIRPMTGKVSTLVDTRVISTEVNALFRRKHATICATHGAGNTGRIHCRKASLGFNADFRHYLNVHMNDATVRKLCQSWGRARAKGFVCVATPSDCHESLTGCGWTAKSKSERLNSVTPLSPGGWEGSMVEVNEI